MNYTLNCPLLKHIALVKVTTTLWNQDDIKPLMYNCTLPNLRGRDKWDAIENKVIEKAPQLPLPLSLKEEILSFIKPIGLQIFKWKENHIERFCRDLPNEFCWTPHGTVDLKKTAKALIKDKSLDVTHRYEIAFTYCLEEDALELWNKIPEYRKKYFYEGLDPMSVRQQDLVVLWLHKVRREVDFMEHRYERSMWEIEGNICSPSQYLFQFVSEIDGNSAAAEYFLQKLTSEEKERSLVRSAAEVLTDNYPKVYKADLLCFLLSQMDERQQKEVFRRMPEEVLYSLLEWPWQSLFLETANRMNLDRDICDLVMQKIIKKVELGFKDYDYQRLFGEFFQLSPEDVKASIRENHAHYVVLRLLHIADKVNVRLILRDATPIQRRKLLFFRPWGLNICKGLVRRGEWDLLRFFIRECISSIGEMRKFKEEFKKSFDSIKDLAVKDQFFRVLDEFILEKSKRKSAAEDESSNPAKRLHSADGTALD